MTSLEDHPLYPADRVPLFIAAGVLHKPEHLEPFLKAKDPRTVPTLCLGGFTTRTSTQVVNPDKTGFVHRPEEGKAGYSRNISTTGIKEMWELKPAIRELTARGIRTIIQVTKLTSDQALEVYPYLVAEAVKLKPTAIEIDLSCITTSEYRSLADDAYTCMILMNQIRHKIGYDVCLGIKDAPHAHEVQDHPDIGHNISELSLAISHNISFVTGIGPINYQKFPELNRSQGRGKLCGPVLSPLAKAHLKLWQQYAPEVAYLSCGGVETANAASEIPERLSLGALLVGGAQEFYRADDPMAVANNWATAANQKLPVRSK